MLSSYFIIENISRSVKYVSSRIIRSKYRPQGFGHLVRIKTFCAQEPRLRAINVHD